MLERISKKTGLTRTELKIFLFAISVLIVGFVYKNFFDRKVEIPYKSYDYTEEDQKFYGSTLDSTFVNPQKSGDKEVDYKQEVLDFNTQGFGEVKKKILPVEKSLNLNKAKIEELVNLPGIGEKTAQKIIEYREKNHGFRNIEQLLNVKGIGKSKLAKIKKYIFID
ncbi:MAG: ComEA family DNA-binding protein [Ignavibacteria bacterium]|nr:ComEA family DNA-binding protein [Ignavibacteria bacterium]